MDTADILDAALQSVPESQNDNRITSIDFSHDLEHRLGCANGNCYQRVPGVENVHDGQIMVRLKKKRFIVIDYSIAPNAAEIAAAQNDPHVQVPSGAGVQKCATVNCNKVGIPVCVFDSEPDEPASLYLRSGLCFTCQRALNEKRRTQKKRKSDVFDPLVINGTPLKDVKRHGKGYEYDEIIMDIEKNNTDLLKKTMDLSRMMIIYGQQGTLSEHSSEIEDLYQSTYVSASKSMFLLNQWKLSFDDAMKDHTTNVAEPSNAVESAAAVVAAQSKSMPPLPKVYEYDQKFKC